MSDRGTTWIPLVGPNHHSGVFVWKNVRFPITFLVVRILTGANSSTQTFNRDSCKLCVNSLRGVQLFANHCQLYMKTVYKNHIINTHCFVCWKRRSRQGFLSIQETSWLGYSVQKNVLWRVQHWVRIGIYQRRSRSASWFLQSNKVQQNEQMNLGVNFVGLI